MITRNRGIQFRLRGLNSFPVFDFPAVEIFEFGHLVSQKLATTDKLRGRAHTYARCISISMTAIHCITTVFGAVLQLAAVVIVGNIGFAFNFTCARDACDMNRLLSLDLKSI